MASATRDGRLESRTARQRIVKRHPPYWVRISKNLYLGYRKGLKSASWLVRLYDKTERRYTVRVLAMADDNLDSNGNDILTYFEAQEAARDYAEQVKQATLEGHTQTQKPPTVADVMEEYLDWYAINRKSLRGAKYTIDIHILPHFGKKLVSDLSTREISQWRDKLAKEGPGVRSKKGTHVTREINHDDDDVKRKRRATVNRILTTLKAALSHSFDEGMLQGAIASKDAWANVKPFKEVDVSDITFLSKDECKRLLLACPENFSRLVMAALLTGGRYGELGGIKCGDFSSEHGRIVFRITKSGKPRTVWLTREGIAFFSRMTDSMGKDETIFQKADGTSWGKSCQARPMLKACKLAGIIPAVSFHGLRRTYGSLLASNGVPLQVIAESLGHADTRITQRHYSKILPSYVADTIRKNLPEFGGNDLIEGGKIEIEGDNVGED